MEIFRDANGVQNSCENREEQERAILERRAFREIGRHFNGPLFV